MIVAFAEAESQQGRFFRQVATGDFKVTRRPPTLLHREAGGEYLPRYWCAADKPATDDGFAVIPVYRTQTVPESARCEDCGISIRELQRLLEPTKS
jgi:hypothetical protein